MLVAVKQRYTGKPNSYRLTNVSTYSVLAYSNCGVLVFESKPHLTVLCLPMF